MTRATPGPPSATPASVAERAAVLRRLELDVTRRLDGLLSGEHLAAVTGPGSEPAGARPYEPGDDARRIDWNLTSRSLVPHLRTTEADRELETWIVVDRSASLDFGTARREKREVALAAVATFGLLNARGGNRVGVVVSGGDRLTRLPARTRPAGVLAALAVVFDTPRRERGPAPAATLEAALVGVERSTPRRGQVVVVSDFLDRADWSRPLRRLALRHQVVGVHVTDPREQELPAVGMLSVVDPETGRRLDVQTSSESLRRRYAEAANARYETIRRTLVGARCEYLHLSTDRDWLVDVARFIGDRRARRVARARGRAAR